MVPSGSAPGVFIAQTAGVGRDDPHRPEGLVGHLRAVAADLRGVGDRVGVELVDERPLPLARAREGGVCVTRAPARAKNHLPPMGARSPHLEYYRALLPLCATRA